MFDRIRKQDPQSMEEYIMDFDRGRNMRMKFNLEIPDAVLAFKLLDYAHLSQMDTLLVIIGIHLGGNRAPL